jgi:tetratricopeptide (TPR) repeat protein
MKQFLILWCVFILSCNFIDRNRFEKLIENATENLEKKRYEDALDNIEKASQINSDTSVIYSLRGTLYFETKRYDLSKIDFLKALTYNPRNTSYFFYLGLNYFSLERDDSALYYYDLAIDSKGDGEVYLEMNKEPFGKYFQDDISMEVLRYYRGISYYMVNRFNQAYQDFLFAKSKQYNVGDCFLYIGIMQIDLENKEEGCKMFDSAWKYGNLDAKRYKERFCK